MNGRRSVQHCPKEFVTIVQKPNVVDGKIFDSDIFDIFLPPFL